MTRVIRTGSCVGHEKGEVGRGRKTLPYEDTRPCRARPAHDRETNQNEENEEKGSPGGGPEPAAEDCRLFNMREGGQGEKCWTTKLLYAKEQLRQLCGMAAATGPCRCYPGHPGLPFCAPSVSVLVFLYFTACILSSLHENPSSAPHCRFALQIGTIQRLRWQLGGRPAKSELIRQKCGDVTIT